MASRRQVRASALLKAVVLVGCVGAVVGVLALAATPLWLLLVPVVWFCCIETDLLAGAIARCWPRHRAGAPIDSIWLVDVEAERQRALADFHRDSQDNPTIR
jgi:hypothetical protein